jgi:hypothetical protein
MPTLSPNVQPAAWHFRELPDALRRVEVLLLPSAIFKSLKSLDERIERIPRFASLHDAIGTFSHSVIAFEPNFWKQEGDNPRWMYITGSEAINKEKLTTLIKTWVKVSYGEAQMATVTKDWKGLDWGADKIDLATCPEEVRKRVFPALVARWLLHQKHLLTLESEAGLHPMPLRLVPLMSMRNHAELMTEPEMHEGQLVCFVLRFSLQTVPMNGREEFVLHQRTLVRRWVSKPQIVPSNKGEGEFVRLRWGEGRIVYLRRHTGYIDRQPRTDVFSRITLKYVHSGLEGLRWVGIRQSFLQRCLSVRIFRPPMLFSVIQTRTVSVCSCRCSPVTAKTKGFKVDSK